MPRWLLNEDVAEDLATATLHRLACPDLDRTHCIVVYRAGSALDHRDAAPRECWSCRPAIELRLGA